MVGCVHPSKVYGVLAVGRPLILLGPSPCHVTDLFERHDCGWRLAHGDVEGFVHLLRCLASPAGESELEKKRLAAARVFADDDKTGGARTCWLDTVEEALRGNRG